MKQSIPLTMAAAALAAVPIALAAVLCESPAPAWLLAASVAVIAALEAHSAPATDSSGSLLDGSAAAASGLALLGIWLVAAATASPAGPLGIGIGMPVFVAGGLLRVAALRTLGERFCSHVRAAPACDLVTTGIYGWIRHPSELGMLLLALGAALVTMSAAAAVVWLAVLLPLVLVRTAREDRQLELAYGERHAAYCLKVSRFSP